MTDGWRSELAAFVREHPRSVLTTVSAEGAPEAALLDVAATDEGEIVLDSAADARKVANIRQDPRVALVVGVDDVCVQVEGTAEVLDGASRARFAAVYEQRFPGSRADADGFAVILVHPRWMRLYDTGTTPPTVRESGSR